MISVIEHGKQRFEVVCQNCGCRYEYDLSDLMGLRGTYCPECKSYVVHPDQSENKSKILNENIAQLSLNRG